MNALNLHAITSNVSAIIISYIVRKSEYIFLTKNVVHGTYLTQLDRTVLK